MIAAIYARKSTDQSAVGEDAKSVTRQVEHARAFAQRHGWTVTDTHIYVDDGVSGALFGDRRPGLFRLLNALTPRPPFDVLIMSEESRLGREMHQTAHIFGAIIRAGVRIWFYLDGRERRLDTAMDKMMLSLSTFAAEIEREKARQRTRDAMRRRAAAGHVTGGKVYGYANIRRDTHVERQILPAEAAVVRHIFEWFAQGLGLRAIAHRLNADGHPAPRPQRGRPAGWAPSSVRDVLGRPIYRGVIEWDRQPRNNERRQLRQDTNATPLTVPAPHLQIVSADLAARVDDRRRAKRDRYVDTQTGRLKGGAAPRRVRYALAGVLRCPCGATFEGTTAPYGARRGGVYVCTANRRKGSAVCANRAHLAAAETEAAILGVLRDQLLDPAFYAEVTERAVARLSTDAARAAHRAEHDRLSRERDRLVAAIAEGGSLPALLEALRDRDARLAVLTARLALPAVQPARVRANVRTAVEALRAQFEGDPNDVQRFLRAVLAGPITLGSPVDGRVVWRAETHLGPVTEMLWDQLASPAGFALSPQVTMRSCSGVLAVA